MKLSIFLLILCAFFVLLASLSGVKKTELAECKQWQEQAQNNEYYTLAAWQLEQCAAHDITIK